MGGAGGSQIERGGHLNSKCREVRLHAIAADGICRKPAGARVPVTGGTGGHGAHAPSGPRREWRRRGRRRTPPLGVALARLRALEPPPPAGRDAAGTPRAASGGVGRLAASLPCVRDGARSGRGRAARCARWPRRGQFTAGGRHAGDGGPRGWATERLDADGAHRCA